MIDYVEVKYHAVYILIMFTWNNVSQNDYKS